MLSYDEFKKLYNEFKNNSSLNVIKLKTKKSYIERLSNELGKTPEDICLNYEPCEEIDFKIFKK